MFTHGKEAVSILLSLELVSIFGRSYLEGFVRSELVELTHCAFCIALSQVYFNDYSIIQASCGIITFFVALMYRTLCSLIASIVIIVCRIFYLTSAAARFCASHEFIRKNSRFILERLSTTLNNAGFFSSIFTSIIDATNILGVISMFTFTKRSGPFLLPVPGLILESIVNSEGEENEFADNFEFERERASRPVKITMFIHTKSSSEHLSSTATNHTKPATTYDRNDDRSDVYTKKAHKMRGDVGLNLDADEKRPDEWMDPLPNGEGNPVFRSAMNVFYNELTSEIGQIEGVPTEISRERILYSVTACKSLSNDIVRSAEQLSTSRGARVEDCFRRGNSMAHRDPMEYLSYYCYNFGFKAISSHQHRDDARLRNIKAQRFQDLVYGNRADANGNFCPSSIDTVFEAYKLGSSEARSMREHFLEDVEHTLNSYSLPVDMETCIRYLDTVIWKINQNKPIAFEPLLHFARLYLPLKKVYKDSKKEIRRRNSSEKRYCDFIMWAESKTSNQEHDFCKDSMSYFGVWDEPTFCRDLLESQERSHPTEKLRRLDKFHKLWRRMRHKKQ